MEQKKLTMREYVDFCIGYSRSDKRQRAGQFLLNELSKLYGLAEPDPKIFYETSNQVACEAFVAKYVEQ